MLNLQLARKYSRAIFELAQDEGKLVPYGEELAGVYKDLESVPGIWGYFSNPELQRSDKRRRSSRSSSKGSSPRTSTISCCCSSTSAA